MGLSIAGLACVCCDSACVLTAVICTIRPARPPTASLKAELLVLTLAGLDQGLHISNGVAAAHLKEVGLTCG